MKKISFICLFLLACSFYGNAQSYNITYTGGTFSEQTATRFTGYTIISIPTTSSLPVPVTVSFWDDYYDQNGTLVNSCREYYTFQISPSSACQPFRFEEWGGVNCRFRFTVTITATLNFPIFNRNSAPGDYCANSILSFSLVEDVPDLEWQLRVESGPWERVNTVVLDRTTTFTPAQQYPTSPATVYLNKQFYFRAISRQCDANLISSPVLGPYVFTPARPYVTSTIQVSPTCKDQADSKILITGIDRPVFPGENLTYTVSRPDNTFIAQVWSSAEPTPAAPLVIDGSNNTMAPFGILADSYKILITSNQSFCGSVNYYTVPTITNPSVVTFDVQLQPPTCAGSADGSFTITGNGGSGTGYSYSANGGLTFQTNQTISGLAPGNYPLMVKDGNNCASAITQSSISDPPRLVINSVEVMSNYNGQPVSCSGASDGSIKVLATGGTGILFYSYNGVRFLRSNLLTGIPAGVYSITVKDENDCLTTVPQVLAAPPDIAVTLANVQHTSCNQDNGAAAVNVAGGIPDYNYEWFNSSNASVGTTSTISNLSAGTYRIVVTDQNNCTKQQTVAISSSNGPSITTQSVVPASCSYTNDGSASISVAGGSTPYTIRWPDGQSTATVNDLRGGSYQVEVRDNANCLTIETITVPAPDELRINTLTQADPNCAGRSDGQLSIEAIGGNGNYTYHWNTGSTASTIANLTAGIYTATVKDVKNCLATRELVLLDPPAFTVDLGPDQKICDGMTITINAEEDNATYAWSSSNGFSSGDRTVQLTQAGTYTLTVITAKGCEGSDSFELTYDTNVLTSDFLMTSEAHAGDTVMLIDISWPAPEQTQWSYESNPIVVEETRDYAMIRYDQTGEYTIALQARLAQCSGDHEQQLTILEALPRVTTSRTEPNIVSVSAYPNPSPDEVTVSVELSNQRTILIEVHEAESGKRIFHEQLAETKSHTRALNLSALPRGVYVISIKSGHDTRSIKVVKK